MRIVHEEYKQLLATVEECRQERHFDVVYCWTKLVAAHAFRHVAQCKYSAGRPIIRKVSKIRIWLVPPSPWAEGSYSSGPPDRGTPENPHLQNLANDRTPQIVQYLSCCKFALLISRFPG